MMQMLIEFQRQIVLAVLLAQRATENRVWDGHCQSPWMRSEAEARRKEIELLNDIF